MRKGPLIHPRMLQSLTPIFYPDLADFEYLPDEALNSIHDASAQADWTPFLSSIPCYLSAVITKRGDEMRMDKTTVVSTDFFLHLNAYYATINEKMRVKVSRARGTAIYNILSISYDSQTESTKLDVQVVS